MTTPRRQHSCGGSQPKNVRLALMRHGCPTTRGCLGGLRLILRVLKVEPILADCLAFVHRHLEPFQGIAMPFTHPIALVLPCPLTRARHVGRTGMATPGLGQVVVCLPFICIHGCRVTGAVFNNGAECLAITGVADCHRRGDEGMIGMLLRHGCSSRYVGHIGDLLQMSRRLDDLIRLLGTNDRRREATKLLADLVPCERVAR